jgi:hypothetical protein
MDNTIVKHFLDNPQSAINVDLLTETVNGWFDAYELNSGQIQIIASAGITAGAIIFEQTNNATVATGVALQVNEVNTNAITTTAINIAANSNRMFQMAILCRYIRVRISTAFVGGTVKAASYFSEQPISSLMTLVTQQSGTTMTLAALAAGANQIGDTGMLYRANATGAALNRHLISLASTNSNLVKNTAGRVLGWKISNSNAAWRYVKIYNQTAAPTAGAGTPILTIGVPPNGTVSHSQEGGIGFSTGIAFTTTAGAADNDTVAVGLNDLAIDLFYA